VPIVEEDYFSTNFRVCLQTANSLRTLIASLAAAIGKKNGCCDGGEYENQTLIPI
jgi:hypothetical protein